MMREERDGDNESLAGTLYGRNVQLRVLFISFTGLPSCLWLVQPPAQSTSMRYNLGMLSAFPFLFSLYTSPMSRISSFTCDDSNEVPISLPFFHRF